MFCGIDVFANSDFDIGLSNGRKRGDAVKGKHVNTLDDT
jgi:hypothetical protein